MTNTLSDCRQLLKYSLDNQRRIDPYLSVHLINSGDTMHTMEERSVIHSTFVIERTYPAKPERVFAAFADPGKKRRWFFEGDHHEVQHHEMDFRVGGKESARLLFKEGTPIAGSTITNNSTYLDIVPESRIVLAYSMTMNGKCISTSLATIEILPAGAGTNLVMTHQGAYFEGADGPEMRQGGWRKLMEKLAIEVAKVSDVI
jgi:uncharacterized protein YndB with AHSA1/START domain